MALYKGFYSCLKESSDSGDSDPDTDTNPGEPVSVVHIVHTKIKKNNNKMINSAGKVLYIVTTV